MAEKENKVEFICDCDKCKKAFENGSNICSNCDGTGIDGDFEDRFECGHCNGKGIIAVQKESNKTNERKEK